MLQIVSASPNINVAALTALGKRVIMPRSAGRTERRPQVETNDRRPP